LLAILVVTQSITVGPPLQDKLSTRSSRFPQALRQSLKKPRAVLRKQLTDKKVAA
jgi:hypothetical protein